eukprot:TRINITY_DN7583_c0_g1_i1.p1 TRINITY_DN7583_c0_g1~~TRINITY_DN7583_c0_g1_i1.p1  ORF type:complete len:716 (-),score=145.99 TRINITY_DN7583_c0_g1_i1:371-2518(-)
MLRVASLLSAVWTCAGACDEPRDCSRLQEAALPPLPPGLATWRHGHELKAACLEHTKAMDMDEMKDEPAEKVFDRMADSMHLHATLRPEETSAYKQRFVKHWHMREMCMVADDAIAQHGFAKAVCKALHMEKPLWVSSDSLGDAVPVTRSPPRVERDGTTYDWCACGTGLEKMTFWNLDKPEERTVVAMNSSLWMNFSSPVSRLGWICNGESRASSTTLPHPTLTVSLTMWRAAKSNLACSSQPSGRLRWNTWKATDYLTSVLFTSHTDGFSCFKIPAMLRTQKGTLIAFAEARKESCDDFAKTLLVYKRSTDGGATWSSTSVLVDPEGKDGVCGAPLVIGNCAPVQLAMTSQHHPGRILVPHTHNNFKFWMTHSDDDGLTWSPAAEIPNVTRTEASPDCERGMDYYGFEGLDTLSLHNFDDILKFAHALGWGKTDPLGHPGWRAKMKGPWQFTGLGPPGSLQLRSGRVLVPGYHSWLRGLSGGNGQLPVSQLYNNLAFGHLLISDDGGDTWRLGSENGFADGAGNGANENQMVQLSNGSILTNMRSLSTGTPQFRLQARSDDDGETFTATEFVYDLPQPFNGCQGSTVVGSHDAIYVTTPDPAPGTGLIRDLAKLLGARVNLTGRNHLTVFKSVDGGRTYPFKYLIDEGDAMQTSLQYLAEKQQLQLLHEQADPAPAELSDLLVGSLVVQLPDRFVFRVIDERIIPGSHGDVVV